MIAKKVCLPSMLRGLYRFVATMLNHIDTNTHTFFQRIKKRIKMKKQNIKTHTHKHLKRKKKRTFNKLLHSMFAAVYSLMSLTKTAHFTHQNVIWFIIKSSKAYTQYIHIGFYRYGQANISITRIQMQNILFNIINTGVNVSIAWS